MNVMTKTKEVTATPKAVNDAISKRQPAAARRMHVIDVRNLIVHKYSENEALLKKADKVAQDLIAQDLRDGEYMRALRPGVYQLFCPNLTPEAGELRTSVLATQVGRAIRDVNPSYKKLVNDEMVSHPIEPVRVATKAPPPDVSTQEMRKLASEAIKMMGPSEHILKLEELTSEGTMAYVHKALKVEYQPIWNVSRDYVTGYRWVATIHGHKTAGNDRKFISAGLDIALFKATVDTTLMTRVTDVIRELVEAASPAIMLLPVHYSTLEQPRLLSAFIDALTRVPQSFRQFLVCEIIGMPAGLSKFRLREVMGYLKSRCRSVFVRTGLDVASLEEFKSLGILAVGLSCADYQTSESEFMRYINAFAIHAEKAGLQIYLTETATRSILMGAIGAGFSYIDGDAAIPTMDEPSKIHRFEIENIYLRPAGYAEATGP